MSACPGQGDRHGRHRRPKAGPARPRERLHPRGRRGALDVSRASRPASNASTSPSYSFDPATLPGNIEHFVGVAQVPIGIAGPLLVDGEHAQGEFYVPLATTEGTLVASYNRGMKLLRAAGGVTMTIVDDAMQRAPAFVFDSAREARAFGHWLTEHFDEIKARGRRHDELRPAARHRAVPGQPHPLHALQLHDRRRRGPEHDRQGDRRRRAGGSSSTAPEIRHFFLESNFATDKKSSQVNMLHTRGKRVVAELTFPADLRARGMMHVEPRAALPRAPGLQPRRLHVRRQQQRRALGQRDHRDVHRHRPGRRQRRGVLGRLSSTPSCAPTATTTTRSRSRR